MVIWTKGNNWTKGNKQLGFSLIEMMVVVALIAIVALIAYPSVMELRYTMESKRVEAAFRQGLRLARAQSHISRKDVVICTLDAMGVCKRDGDTTLTLFYDNNKNNKKDNDDTIIHQENWHLRYGTILLRTSLTRDYIRYMGDTAKPRGHIGHLRYCSVSQNSDLSFKVIVNMAGNVRVERGLVGC